MAFLSTSVADALSRLQAGKLVAVPTETVYGLAADAGNAQAVASIFATKGRPSSNPLILHVANMHMAKRYVQVNALAEQLAHAHWPGALTLVLPKRSDAPVVNAVSAGGSTLAIRMPSHPLMQALLEGFGAALAAPSANRSGRISPTQAAHVLEEFPAADVMVMDGGACEVGLESTVVDCAGTTPKCLRAGSVLLGLEEEKTPQDESKPLLSPGLLTSHYAPSLPVRLNAKSVKADEALLAFGAPLQGAAHMLNLSEAANLEQAASQLFALLRQLDQPHYQAIAVMPIPETGIGIAINDRLRRAAAER